jgi:hypothetical protein
VRSAQGHLPLTPPPKEGSMILTDVSYEGEMADSNVLNLLNEAEKLGILNIDVTGDHLSPEVIQNAIEATKQLNSRLDKKIIAQKLREVDSVVAARYK